MPLTDKDKERYELIQRCTAQGITREQTAVLAQCSIRTVTRLRAAAARTRGRKRNADAARRDLAKGLAQRTLVKGCRVIPEFPSTPSIAAEMRRLGYNVTARTVLRDICAMGGKSRVRPRHPNLVKAPERKAFAGLWRAINDEKLDRLVFSDEHFISVNDHSCRRMFVFGDEAPLPREFQRRQNVANFQIWAAIGVGWRSKLVFFPKKHENDDGDSVAWAMNGTTYIKRCLSTVSSALVARRSIFMQDNARCHTAKKVLAYLAGKRITLLRDYPAGSPDMNPIEKVWAHLDSLIAKRMPSTEAELKQAAIAAWESIPQEKLDNYVRSFRSACVDVYNKDGK